MWVSHKETHKALWEINMHLYLKRSNIFKLFKALLVVKGVFSYTLYAIFWKTSTFAWKCIQLLNKTVSFPKRNARSFPRNKHAFLPKEKQFLETFQSVVRSKGNVPLHSMCYILKDKQVLWKCILFLYKTVSFQQKYTWSFLRKMHITFMFYIQLAPW